MIQPVLFIFGASIGSFINVLAVRYDPAKSFWTLFSLKRGLSPGVINRSHCPYCGKVLQWHELIPIASFIIQAGQCRGCGKPISWQYPIVEVIMGGLAVGLVFLISPISFIGLMSLSLLLFLLASLVTIALIDLRTTIIPDELVIIALVLTFLTSLTFLTGLQTIDLLPRVFGFLIGGGVLTVLWAIGRGGWMGLGDGKLGAILGLWLGYPNIILALGMAFISGSVISIGLIMLQRKTLKDTVPFGPFLVLGGIAAFFLQGWFEGWWRGLWL